MNFYLINNDLFKDLKFGYGEPIDPVNHGSATKCENCGRYLTMKAWLPPYKVKMSRPYLGDFITGSVQYIIVSDNFRKAYIDAGLKGLNEFYKVDLYYKRKLIEDKQYFFSPVSLSNARVDIIKSGIQFENGNDLCKLCQNGQGIISHMNGILFENPEAVEEDIFDSKVFPGPIVSERFKRFVEENGFTNLKLIDISTYVPPWLRSPFDGFKIKWDYKKDK